MNAVVSKPPSQGLVSKFAGKYGVDPDKLLTTLKATAFQSDKEISNEQMMSLLIVADQYSLNPFTKEIYAYPDRYKGIVPIVSVDGWVRIINEHPQMDGIEFAAFKDEAGKVVEMTCSIWRKDRSRPISITEYMEECFRANAGPWQTHPNRMLRHKTLIQCARVAFGFAGIYDEDEAQRILAAQADAQPVNVTPGASRTSAATEAARRMVGGSAKAGDATATLVGDVPPATLKADELPTDVPIDPPGEKRKPQYTSENAVKLLRTAANRKALEPLWNVILEDFDFCGEPVPPDIEDEYKKLRHELAEEPPPKGATK